MSLAEGLRDARRTLLAALPESHWAEQPSAAYSPIGWHLGHVAATQARWLLPGDELGARFGGFFDPTQTSKETRTALPSRAELLGYLEEVFARANAAVQEGRVPRIDGLPPDFLVNHLAQHELQHAEHVAVIARLCEGTLHLAPRPVVAGPRLELAGGEVRLGSDDAGEAYDNERGAHVRRLEPFWIDARPATVGEFSQFVAAGGYEDERLWSPEGWQWRVRGEIFAPPGWRTPPDAAQPVSCISWFEADAYARWRGARLPAEAEWECARRAGLPGAGEVWEWTASWFEPYPEYRPYPYDGYSSPWFGTHRVLRGGSFATAPRIRARASFRNWYEPGFRELPAGVRCAGSL